MNQFRSIDLNRLSDFLKIAELGSITKAAETLNERKAKLSRNLALLEEELGVQLIYRTTRQMQLTEAGQNLYREAKIQLDQLEQSIQTVMNQDKEAVGKIKLTAPEDFGNHILSRLISDYSKAHPSIEFELIYSNKILDLIKMGIDIAFRIGNLKDSGMIHKKLGYPDFILTASPKYLDRVPPLADPKDLPQLETIAFSGGAAPSWLLLSGTNQRTIRIQPKLVANTYAAVRDLTVLGHGISFIPRFLARDALATGELVHVLRQWGNKGPPVQIAIPPQKNVPVRIRRFFEYASRRVSEML